MHIRVSASRQGPPAHAGGKRSHTHPLPAGPQLYINTADKSAPSQPRNAPFVEVVLAPFITDIATANCIIATCCSSQQPASSSARACSGSAQWSMAPWISCRTTTIPTPVPGIMVSPPGTTGGKTLVLAGGAERRDALSQEPHFLNEIKIAFIFINLLLQLQSAGAAPGTFTGSSAHQLLWQWVTASAHSLSCRSLCPTPGDKWRPTVSTAQQGRRATVLQT